MSLGNKIVLSVVIPVHGVQGYVRQCLESVLEYEGDDIEIIAIDDCTPDLSGQILDEIAATDHRVRVKHLEVNVGLGEARNVGLGLASGEYVWFVDSDDWITEGSVTAIMERLARGEDLDVLMLDYARTYWNGRFNRSVQRKLFREDETRPAVFQLKDRPEILSILPYAWNRVIKRQWLLDLGLRFTKGFYEDSPVSYPVLFAADRIAMLDRVCYAYRQRRTGSITKTQDRRHLDVFGQYDTIFGFIDSRNLGGHGLRKVMFDRMMWHLLIILALEHRIAKEIRPEFFHRTSELYNKYKPEGYTPPDGIDGMKYRLVERDAFAAFERSRMINRVRVSVKKQIRSGKKQVRRAKVASKGKLKGLYYKTQLRAPIDENLAVYASYWLRGAACNPAAIYSQQRRLAPGIKSVWVVRKGTVKNLPEGVPYVIAGTRSYLRTMARAKYFVNNVNFTDDPVKRPGQVYLQTQHGTPLKKMGLDQMDHPVGAAEMDFDQLIERADKWDYLVSANPLMSEAWVRSYPAKYQLLETGYPRNDRLFHATPQERARLRAELGIPEGKTAILYCPTHRDYQKNFTPMFDLAKFARALGDDFVLLLRAHYFYKVKDLGLPEGSVIDVSAHPTVEDLAIASDALLTDYSSIMFDYAVLDQPVVIYANDWDTYRLTRGVNFDLMAEPPGAVATTEHELVETFRTGAFGGDAAAKLRGAFRAKFCVWEDGHAAERVVRRVFLGEQLPR
ncbi:bifunctional glycosyltransferase family 2 protein/CDP-glycerol:glycerophosphate glycerophosphotransferase [Actinocorallia longicatena]|uniref:Bifunctional glycosyltransferase/CDP-glycerol:glycerophosphate glycerophosphotransferase n=1 Tax=Actinocorallia longicatena TaxID=111803 RepID=A0ABP6QLK2_9ACTN